ncbi:hypothetical protein IFM89_004940 [Coptis chinensis]|uniref:Uncharacterized protein n=1 Tax=Coptis chinensis TaxID=261450 RepID=A0A835HT84_9MAGN|nr:hypothetical protein IFM89_004940 [Coptis chinensis]
MLTMNWTNGKPKFSAHRSNNLMTIMLLSVTRFGPTRNTRFEFSSVNKCLLDFRSRLLP